MAMCRSNGSLIRKDGGEESRGKGKVVYWPAKGKKECRYVRMRRLRKLGVDYLRILLPRINADPHL